MVIISKEIILRIPFLHHQPATYRCSRRELLVTLDFKYKLHFRWWDFRVPSSVSICNIDYAEIIWTEIYYETSNKLSIMDNGHFGIGYFGHKFNGHYNHEVSYYFFEVGFFSGFQDHIIDLVLWVICKILNMIVPSFRLWPWNVCLPINESFLVESISRPLFNHSETKSVF